MLSLLWNSLAPILLALIFGWGFGKFATNTLKTKLIKSITYLVWLLLVSIGFQFAQVLADPHIGLKVILNAVMYASVLSLITFLCLYRGRSQVVAEHATKSLKEIITPIKECLIAVLMVMMGVGLYLLFHHTGSSANVSSNLLYVLIFLIGIDLSTVQLQSLTAKHFSVPAIAIVAMLVSAAMVSVFTHYPMMTLMMVGSGFGWFSLSGSLVATLSNTELGSFALLTDLMREFYAIALLYLLGQKMPYPVIGVCGATSMDSTLPFVKKNCSQTDVQIAIFSGFVLTLLAPFLIVLFASFQ
ncbi:lysine exporter LysO family protein [Acinetobacter sp. MD2(2019)]|uniref:lysine exporter LysO family protein n=1 Tax=Acinetobacter sp. MD2(2019) TaxID=2605273 RepID=UPI002D1EAEFE|nr:lysine exporter LysO family protein [Acinetobacter sp. MD2(2019)]MEB3753749.1 lysine exporter LysO family protein [Acinetobacter sp. MD2(2019)]